MNDEWIDFMYELLSALSHNVFTIALVVRLAKDFRSLVAAASATVLLLPPRP